MKLTCLVSWPSRRAGLVVKTALPALLLLSGCGTTVVSSRNLSHADAAQWQAEAPALPVELHGAVPGRSETALTSLFPQASKLQYASLGQITLPAPGKRIVLYVNGTQLPAASKLCTQGEPFQHGQQAGRLADVTAALCDGPEVISTVRGYALSMDQTKQGLQRSFGVIQAGLIDALEPGANDPDQYNH
jgi:hypothetical protein